MIRLNTSRPMASVPSGKDAVGPTNRTGRPSVSSVNGAEILGHWGVDVQQKSPR